mmetsp:Transcript_17376/g.19484  ORF Transcript_17376/g.19484 Transcript_17376/m.19484 type:complete len:151 (+) Transcript_17376:243-695(+)|eukprot:CAMPEP_0205810648 /NCGR_PEP_ID=MMETSP0205-20121125/14822_1 /ASSEMBLY_ACC=CAM_ASM_000278 /TAXON_ID=36767 /ORGANISM="Euplotes focardii, Strain TN1" /LENGTH=150 /DNA_ID=CAMNT_0053088977 /DNA_START=187 /DNA_END=639 /DNA_ORIENTATION=+
MFARFYLHEVLKWKEILGIFLFVPGTIITLIFASKSNDLLDKHEFNEKFFTPIAQLYLWGNILCCIVFYILAYFIIKGTTKEVDTNIRKENGSNGQSTMEESESESLLEGRETPSAKLRRRLKNMESSTTSEMANEDSDDELVPSLCMES